MIRTERAILKRYLIYCTFSALAYAFGHAPTHAQDLNDWQKKLGAFRIGIVGGNRLLLETRQLQPFRIALQKRLGVPVEVFPAKNHQAIVEALVSSRIEYAPLSVTALTAAWIACKCVEPVALPRAADGSTGFRAVVIAKQGGPRSLRALKGKTTIVPGRHSFSGFLFSKAILARQGITLDTDDWPVDDQLDMASAIKAFIDRKGDVLLGWMPDLKNLDARPKRGTLHAVADLTKQKPDDLKILWKSRSIPHGPHVIRKNLPTEAKVLVWNTLRDLRKSDPTAYDAIEPLFGGGFVATGIEEFQPLIELLSVGTRSGNLKKSP